MIKIEQFDKDYKNFVLNWTKIKNNQFSNFPVQHQPSPDEFYSDLCAHLYIKNNIQKFNARYESEYEPGKSLESKFKSWLILVMNNLYIDLFRKFESKETFTQSGPGSDNPRKIRRIVRIDDQDNLNKIDSFNSYEPNYIDSDESADDFESKVNAILEEEANKIEPLKDRVLYKLKIYMDEKVFFADEEKSYMIDNSDLINISELDEYIELNRKDRLNADTYGFKNESIAFLTEYKANSISVIFKRLNEKIVSNLNFKRMDKKE